VNGSVDDSMSHLHKYTYTLKFQFNALQDGFNISYEALGFKERRIEGVTALLMQRIGRKLTKTIIKDCAREDY